MDGLGFDRFTRLLVTRTSRRRALQGTTGGALAGMLAGFGIQEATAACVKLGQKGCKGPQNKKCCPGAVCNGGTKTKTGRCVCKGSLTQCGTKCVDTETNKQHCGDCGQTCGEGQTCALGACVCPQSRTQCGADCVDTTTDARHCGGCDEPCPDREICERGACVFKGGCQTGANYCFDGCRVKKDGKCIDRCVEPNCPEARCPGSTNVRCSCIVDTEGTTLCAYTDTSLYCSPCGTSADCLPGWSCYEAQYCNCPYDPSKGFLGRACAPTRGASEVC